MAWQKLDSVAFNGAMLAMGHEEQKTSWPGHASKNWIQRVSTDNGFEAKFSMSPESEIWNSELVSAEQKMWWPGHAWKNWLQQGFNDNRFKAKFSMTPESEIWNYEVVFANSRTIEGMLVKSNSQSFSISMSVICVRVH